MHDSPTCDASYYVLTRTPKRVNRSFPGRMLVLGRVVLTLFVVLVAPAYGVDFFRDDFSDGSATDGAPVTWEPRVFTNGDFQIVGGDFVLRPHFSEEPIVSIASGTSLQDVSLRTQVRNQGDADGIALFARFQEGVFTYQGGIDTQGDVYIGWNGSDTRYHNLVDKVTSLRPNQQDISLRFDVFGNSLQLFAWPSSESMPLEPTVQVIDNRSLNPGNVGILYDPRTSGSATFRYVEAAQRVPEPNALNYVFPLLGAMGSFRRRRSATKSAQVPFDFHRQRGNRPWFRFRVSNYVAILVFLLMGGCYVGSAAAATLLDETFDDGNAADGSPTTWRPYPGFDNGTYNASSGDLILSPVTDRESLVAFLDPGVSWSDVSVRTELRNGGPGTSANVQATGLLGRVILSPQRSFVEAGIDLDGLIYLDEVTQTDNRRTLASLSTRLRPLTEDVVLQFDMLGNSLKLFAWRAGDTMPSSPQLSALTTITQQGTFGIFNNPPDGNGTATFRYIQVSSIPEPSSSLLLAGLLPGLSWTRRRRFVSQVASSGMKTSSNSVKAPSRIRTACQLLSCLLGIPEPSFSSLSVIGLLVGFRMRKKRCLDTIRFDRHLVHILRPCLYAVAVMAMYHPIGTAQAGMPFEDDFEDGNFTDGTPVSWSRYPGLGRGDVTVEDGRLKITSPTSGDTPFTNYWESDLVVENQLYGNVNVLARVRALADGPSVIGIGLLDTHFTSLGLGVSTNASLQLNGSSRFMAVNYERNTSSFAEIGRVPTSLSAFANEVNLRFAVFNNRANFTAWAVGEPEPEPQISGLLPNSLFGNVEGRVVIFAGNFGTSVPIAFDYINVVPEPSSSLIGLGLSAGLTRWRRRRYEG